MQQRLIACLTLTLALGASAFTPAAHAQQPGRPGGRFQRGGPFGQLSVLTLTDAQMDQLKFTADQKSKLNAIRERLQTERRALIGQGAGGDRQAAFQKLQELNQKAQADALAILTDDQKKQFEAMKTAAEAYAGLGRSGAALMSVTGLTDDQKNKLKALAAETQTKRQALFQEFQSGGDRQAAAQKLQSFQTETDAAVKKILTADQAKQFDAALQALPRGGGFGGGRGGGGGGNRP
jgi:Spy/CpxP family protein refolding chaperone